MSAIRSVIPIEPIDHRPPLKPINFRPIWEAAGDVNVPQPIIAEECARIWQAVIDTARGTNVE